MTRHVGGDSGTQTAKSKPYGNKGSREERGRMHEITFRRMATSISWSQHSRQLGHCQGKTRIGTFIGGDNCRRGSHRHELMIAMCAEEQQ